MDFNGQIKAEAGLSLLVPVNRSIQLIFCGRVKNQFHAP